MSASLTISPALRKRLTKTAKRKSNDTGLPEYPDNVNHRRLAAMEKNRADRFRKAFPTEEARQQYGAERLAYVLATQKPAKAS